MVHGTIILQELFLSNWRPFSL